MPCGVRRICMAYSSTSFLGWACTIQILHYLSQRQVRNEIIYFEVDQNLSDLSIPGVERLVTPHALPERLVRLLCTAFSFSRSLSRLYTRECMVHTRYTYARVRKPTRRSQNCGRSRNFKNRPWRETPPYILETSSFLRKGMRVLHPLH